MKCENCSHAEMCKWIDELEGRGCDFGEPCELLILKSDIVLHQDDRKKWVESIKQEKEKGLIILPPYFTPLLVPNDIEIRIEQEPCEDAISLTKEAYSDLCLRASKADDLQRALDMEKGAYNALVKNIQCDDAISREYLKKIAQSEGAYGYVSAHDIATAPSVTQKSGKWIEEVNDFGEITNYHCSKCYEDTGFTTDCKWKYCPNCGAKMVEPQESEE